MIRKTLLKFPAIFDHIVGIACFLAGVVIFLQLVSVSGNTVLRYVFNHPIQGLDASVEYGLLYIPFLSAAWLLKNNGHIRVGIVTDRLSQKNQFALAVFQSTIGAVICLVLAGYGVWTTWDQWVTGAIDPHKIVLAPKAVAVAIIPVGAFLLSIQFVRNAYGNLKGLLGKEQDLTA